MTLRNGITQKLEPILWPSVEILGSKNDPSEQPKSIPKANSLTPCRKFEVKKNRQKGPNQMLEPILWTLVKIFGPKNGSSEQPKQNVRALWGSKMTLRNGLNHKLERILWPSFEILGSKNDPSEQPKSIPKANSLTPCRKFVVQKMTLQYSLNKMLEPFGVLKWPFGRAWIIS